MKFVPTHRCSILVVLILLTFGANASAQALSPSPQSLSFVYQIGGPYPAAQSIVLSAGLPTQFTVTTSGAPWLTISPLSGITPSTLVASVTPPPGVAPGTLTGSIIIGPPAAADNLRTVVPVSLQVLAAPQGNLVVTPDNIAFDARVGGPPPSPVAVSVTSTGSSASFAYSTNTNWLFASANSSVTPAVVQVSAVPNSSMGPGVYNGIVAITPTYAGGAPKQILVTLRMSTAGNLVASPTYLSFSYQPGGPNPAVQTVTIVNSGGTSVPISVTATVNGGGSWFAYSPVTAYTPATVTVSVSPGSLAPGSYTGTLTITQAGGGASPTQIPISLTVYSYSQLIVDPTALSFNYQSGGPLPATQYVSVKSTSVPVTYNASVQGPFISVSPTVGTTPSGLSVIAAPSSAAAPGVYGASIVLTPTNGGGTSVTIPVNITIATANYLTVGRTSVSFDYSTSGANPAPVFVPVTSSTGPLKFEAVAVTQGLNPWLSVSESSQYTPADLTIGVSPQGLTAGTYSGSILINSEDAINGQQNIAVTLVVTTATSFAASPFGLVFSYQIGADPPKAQVFVVSSQGGPVPFSVSPSTSAGGNWLLVVGSGSTPATVGAAVNVSGLSPGSYSGQIKIKGADAAIPVLEVPVVLNVSATPVFLPAMNEVSFQYRTGGFVPEPQQVTIATSGTDAYVFYPTWVTADGGSWLSVTPNVGTTPSAITIAVNPAGLKAGMYYAIVGINDPTGDIPISYVPVTLEVADGSILGVATQALIFNTQTGIGTPAQQMIPVKSTSGGATFFHVTTYGGNWLQATPVDGFTDAQIGVTAVADGLAPGYYLGVVGLEVPGVANSQQYVAVVLVVSPGF